MVGSITATIFYFVAICTLCGAFFMWKKTDEAAYAIVWAPITFLLVTCYQTVWAAILNTLKININLYSIGAIDLITALGFVYLIFRKKEIQKYILEWVDIIATIMIIVLVVILWFGHDYGMDFYINYGTIDPAAHLKAAIDVIQNQCVNNMFYSALFNGLFLEMGLPFKTMDYMYQFFVISDLLNYGIAGIMFFALIRRYLNDKFKMIFVLADPALYVMAYPLNSILYGFVYLGMGVTLCMLIMELARVYLADEVKIVPIVIMLSLACLGIFECYVLFMPIVFFSLIICIWVKQYKKNNLVSKETILICLGVFLVPCIIGIYYTYFGLFGDNLTVGEQIAEEGGIYRELFANYVMPLPFALYEYYCVVKEKKNSFITYFFPITILCMAVLFAGGMMGKVSSYYFYKLPFLFWVALIYLAFFGVVRVAKQCMPIIVTGSICLAGLFVLLFTEEEINSRNQYFDWTYRSHAFLSVYSYNHDLFVGGGYPAKKTELYHWVYNNLLEQGEEMVCISGYYQDDIWFQAITNQRLNGWNFISDDHIAYYEKLYEASETANYIVVIKDDGNKIYADNPEWFESLEKVYENEMGFVAKLDMSTLGNYLEQFKGR